MTCPDDVEKLPSMPSNQNSVENFRVYLGIDELLQLEGRTPTFQAFLDSLDTSAVRRAKVKPERPVLGNYATKR